jgi:hypothetical protein
VVGPTNKIPVQKHGTEYFNMNYKEIFLGKMSWIGACPRLWAFTAFLNLQNAI